MTPELWLIGALVAAVIALAALWVRSAQREVAAQRDWANAVLDRMQAKSLFDFKAAQTMERADPKDDALPETGMGDEVAARTGSFDPRNLLGLPDWGDEE